MNNTYKEINQQPKVWLKIVDLIKKEKNNILKFIDNNIENIVLTGAGTSEFAANCANNFINQNYNSQSIATTDIVSDPVNYFKSNKKYVVISFARSGNSPESLATLEKLQSILKENVKFLNITCNKNGNLAKYAQKINNIYNLILPEETNDKGFAMTSSFTSMLLSAILIFDKNDDIINNFDKLVQNTKDILNIFENDFEEIINWNYKRLVFLGSNNLQYFAQEAALKNLELTQGLIDVYFNSVLGFRHGPKSIVNNETLIFILMSGGEYNRKYDIDLIKELKNDSKAKVIVLDNKYDKDIENIVNNYYYNNNFYNSKNNIVLNQLNGFNYIIYAQLLSVYKSIKLNINPDNPCPSGEVNRVVKGVIIH